MEISEFQELLDLFLRPSSIAALDGDTCDTRLKALIDEVHARRRACQPITLNLFVDVLRWLGRCILRLLEQTSYGLDQRMSVWPSYVWLLQDRFSRFDERTADAVLDQLCGVLAAVRGFPTAPLDLYEEYVRVSQEQVRNHLDAQKEVMAIRAILRNNPTQPDGKSPWPSKSVVAAEVSRIADSDVTATPPLPDLTNRQREIGVSFEEGETAIPVHCTPVAPALGSVNEAKASVARLPERLTGLVEQGHLLFALMNPVPMLKCGFVVNGFRCDACGTQLRAGYQLVLFNDKQNGKYVRSSFRLRSTSNAVGFDLCIACAVYFLREAEERMRLALHRPFVPFAAGALAGLQSQVVAHHGDWVEVVVRVSPWDVRPVVWVLDAEGATPPADWRARVTVRRMADDGGSVAEEDVCPICLDPLANEAPVRRTRCGHWFHADCIQEVIRSVDSACPMCRTMNVLETPELAEVLERNVYAVRVELTMAERQREEVLVGIGAILTADWQYHNVTNLCACEVVAVRRAAKGPPAAVPPPLPPGRKAT